MINWKSHKVEQQTATKYFDYLDTTKNFQGQIFVLNSSPWWEQIEC